jgi:hypothetical protein
MTIAAMRPRLANAAEPLAPLGNSKLASMALRGDDLAPVWNALVARVNVDPNDAAAFLDLSIIAHIQDRPADRTALRERAFALTRVFRQPAAQMPVAVRLLAFVAGGDYLANMPVEFLLDGSSVTLDLVYVLPDRPLPDVLPDHDAAFVAIAESEENQPLLDALAGILRAWPRPVINRPEKIAPLTRDGTWALLNDAPGLVVPVNARIARAGLERVARGAYDIESLLAGSGFPIIARPLDSHLGDGLGKLEDADAVAAYLRERAEGEFYIAPFVDYRQADGFYRKYRVALIDGRAYAVHMAVSSHWMINYINADMKLSAAKRAEEARFMADFDRDFGVRHAEAMSAISARVGLDYLPFDCGETRDGKLLLFELGTNMIVHAMDAPDVFPYKRPQMAKVFSAFAAMLRRHGENAGAAPMREGFVSEALASAALAS